MLPTSPLTLPLTVPPTLPVFTVSQQFYFDAAHTLQRAMAGEAEGSRRIHGHTHHAEVFVTGPCNPATGMVMDLGVLRERLVTVRAQLDHHLLNEVAGLGMPTLENLCVFIAAALHNMQPAPSRVRVWRKALGDACEICV